MSKKANYIPPNQYYDTFQRDQIYHGKTYSDLVQDWFNWFLSTDADKRTLGPVVFLRSKGTQTSEITGIKDSTLADNQGQSVAYSGDLFYPQKYTNDPNVRVGSDRYQIYPNQAVFIPIIVSYWVASKPFHDWGIMQEFNGLTIDYGDNPPTDDQFKIYAFDLDISPGKSGQAAIELKKFRVSTPIFTAIVPDSDFGRSNRDFLEESITPGYYPAMVEGYFVLIRFNTPTENGKNYFVHTWASAPREVNGPYFSELFYEIEVMPKGDEFKKQPIPGFRHARNDGIIAKMLNEKMKAGQIDSSVGMEIGRRLNLPVNGNSNTPDDPSVRPPKRRRH